MNSENCFTKMIKVIKIKLQMSLMNMMKLRQSEEHFEQFSTVWNEQTFIKSGLNSYGVSATSRAKDYCIQIENKI